MRSKLVFPSGGMETKYVWNKSTVNDKGVFVWDKNYINVENEYTWAKHLIDNSGIETHQWDRYEAIGEIGYQYKIFEMVETTDYVWHIYDTELRDAYIRFNVAVDQVEIGELQDLTIDISNSLSYGIQLYGGGESHFTYQSMMNYSGQVVLNSCFAEGVYALEIQDATYTGHKKYIFGIEYDNQIYLDGTNLTFKNVIPVDTIPSYLSFLSVGSTPNYNPERYYYIGQFKYPYRLSKGGIYSSSYQYYLPTDKYEESRLGTLYYYNATNSGFFDDVRHFGSSAADGSYGTYKIKDKNSYTISVYDEDNKLGDWGIVGANNTGFEYYELMDETTILNPTKGSYVDSVTADNADAYPSDGVLNQYWYVYNPVYRKSYHWEKYAPTAKHSWRRFAYSNFGVSSNGLSFTVGESTTSNDGDEYFKLLSSGKEYYCNVDLQENFSYSPITFEIDKNRTEKYWYVFKNIIPYRVGDTSAYKFSMPTEQYSDKDLYDVIYPMYERYCNLLNVPVGKTITIPFLPMDISMISDHIDNYYYMISVNIEIRSTSLGLHITCPEIYKKNYDNSLSGFDEILFRPAAYPAYNIIYPIQFYGRFIYLTDELSFLLMLANHPDMFPQTNNVPMYSLYEQLLQRCDNDAEKAFEVYKKFAGMLSTEGWNINNELYGTYAYNYFGYPSLDIDLKELDGGLNYYENFGDYKNEYIWRTYGEPIRSEAFDIVYSTDITAYPMDGQSGAFWYEYIGAEDDYDNLEYLNDVSSLDRNAYPDDGILDGFYYIYSHYTEQDVLVAGDYIEDVKAINNSTAYPQNGILNGYWYVYKTVSTSYYKGEYIERIEDIVDTAYPNDGIQGDYWYVYKGWEDTGRYEGRFIQQVETNDPNAYPTNGIDKNYWYKFVKSYEGYKLQITDAEIKGGIDYNLDVNPEEDYIVGTVASAEIAFEYNNINRDIQQYIDANECIYYTWQPADNDWRQIGIFYLEDVTEIRDTIKVKAYDSIIKTETYIDELIENINNWPLNINQMFNKTCEYLGLNGIINNSVSYGNYFIKDNFEAVNITGRQLLQYIAEAAGGLIMANADGALYLTKYSSKNISLDKSKYVRYIKHNYSTQPIQGVNVRVTSDDMGITAGADSGNVYIVENNPLFFDTTGTATQTAVNNLYNKLKDVSYVPAEVELLQDFGINCGDIITVDEDTFYVMSKNLSASGCKLKCVGNKHRQLKESGLNSDIIALRGKTNELYRDLEQTKSTLTDIEADLKTEITQTAEEIKLYASNLSNTVYSSLQVDIDSISSEVVNLEDELSSRIEQTESSITSQVTEQGRVITEIRQDLDGIELSYNSENGTASITIGDITVTDLVNGEYVTRTVAGIDLTGYVTFHSLETAGATTINGSNITTGTISADRINMTGAITWGDLSSDVQDAIDAGVSGDTDIPDYIKSTYIDGARIESPTINGGVINSISAYGDVTHTTVIEDSQIDFRIKEYSSTGGSFSYSAGYIDAYVNDVGLPESARTGLRIVAPWNGDGYTGGLTLEANRGMVLNAGQDIFFYIPGHQGVALSTILDRLGL